MNKIALAHWIRNSLLPFSRKVEVGGSIRRGVQDPQDIDIVIIPVNMNGIVQFLRRNGTITAYGKKRIDAEIRGVKVNLFITDDLSWGATLMYSTGPKGSNIWNRKLARSKGMVLNQWGLFDAATGKRLPAQTEQQIYKALGKPYRSPEERGKPRQQKSVEQDTGKPGLSGTKI